MKILVIGGAGYIGSHISEILIKKYKNVFLIDNLSTGHRKLINKKAKFIKGDIQNIKLVRKIIKENEINTIIHLAGLIDVLESGQNKKKYLQNFINFISCFL